MNEQPVLRVARPTDQLETIRRMYRDGLGLEVLGEFEGHDGFDGAMLGHPNAPYHLEFTTKRGHTAGRAPSQDHLLVFYIPERPLWEQRCERMTAAGFRKVESFNPYWDERGATFEDADGYRIVLQNGDWPV